MNKPSKKDKHTEVDYIKAPLAVKIFMVAGTIFIIAMFILMIVNIISTGKCH